MILLISTYKTHILSARNGEIHTMSAPLSSKDHLNTQA